MDKNKGSQPIYKMKVEAIDQMVPMRDGAHLAVDIYRPDAEGKFPALLSIAMHNKALQNPEINQSFSNQPAWAPLWAGVSEAGDTQFFTSRGYVHVIGNYRGFGKSGPGNFFVNGKYDLYDLIEWIAEQPWCDGNVGMVGISGFAKAQSFAAYTRPPHLKAIFNYDHGEISFRDTYPGGVLHTFWMHMGKFAIEHYAEPNWTPEEEALIDKALDNPDFKMYPHIYNALERKGQIFPGLIRDYMYPYEPEDQTAIEEEVNDIDIPFYTGTGAYAYTYKVHMNGAHRRFQHCTKAPFKKFLFTGPAHLPRPFNIYHDEILRWYDYWLKGIDTGIKEEPPVKIWNMGANKWRYADTWPLPQTQWTKLYLDSWERLRWEPFAESSGQSTKDPDAFAQMPLRLTRKVQKLRYVTEPLPEDVEVTGPLQLTFWAEIDQDDTNWIIIVKDLGPDVSVQTAREGEFERPEVPEREVTRGWLKASYRAVDESKSLPGQPHHYLTESKQQKVVPGEINRYDVAIAPTSNVFLKNHRICVDITSMDVPPGTAGDVLAEYIPYHICSSKTVLHKVYRDEEHPSHLLIPVIPKED